MTAEGATPEPARSCHQVFALDEDAALEAGARADEGDQVGSCDRTPAFLGGLDQLEHHGEGGWAAGPAGDLGPQPDRGGRGLDRRAGRPEDEPVPTEIWCRTRMTRVKPYRHFCPVNGACAAGSRTG